jgi:hypothetical protein
MSIMPVSEHLLSNTAEPLIYIFVGAAQRGLDGELPGRNFF